MTESIYQFYAMIFFSFGFNFSFCGYFPPLILALVFLQDEKAWKATDTIHGIELSINLSSLLKRHCVEFFL